MSNINKLTISSSASYDIIGTSVLVVKSDTGRSYLAHEHNGEIIGSGYTSEVLALAALEKLENRRTTGNLHGLRFGGKISSNTVKAYAKKVWGDELTLSNVIFKNAHYWMATVTNKAGEVVDSVRADYVINFMRIPAGLESAATIAMAEMHGARVSF